VTAPSAPRRPTRLAEKASTDRAALDALLDTAVVGHFGLVAEDGTPVVIPTAVVRDGDLLLAHGSTGSRWMRRLARGVPTALAVTSYDGLVVARSAFESSLRYRSAVLFGSCSTLPDDEKERALDLVTDTLVPGRVAEVRRPTRAELAATLVLALPIDDWSLKVSDGWPEDEPEDVAGPAWAGVVPLRRTYDAPLAAPDLAPGIEVPASVRALTDRTASDSARWG
jgi:nitroimidazol reductase NimA-like FMN-containing flavoprotein (pyridoxamine 5'-phosphate oxidase superfamily)